MEITREELFERIWNEPASTLAQSLGISDVALGKLCRRLQVPKPPRGYWARKRAGKRVRQPPLPAFIEESDRQAGKGRQRHRPKGPRLSPRKRELFDHAVRHLRKDGPTDHDFTLSDSHLTWIDPDFAAALLMAIGQNYRKWGLPSEAGMRAVQGLVGVAQRLVDDLLPLARDRVIIFPPPEERYTGARFVRTGNHAVVRFTPELVRTVAKLANMARDQQFDFVAYRLGSDHQFWRVRWVHDPDQTVFGETRLCVSHTHAWIRYEGSDIFGDFEILETASVPLERLAPVELLGEAEIDVSTVRARTHQQCYASRLKAILQARQACDIAERASLDGEMALEQETLTRMLSLWGSEEQLKTLQHIQNWVSEMTARMETWYDAIERETEALCLQVLGIRFGDCVAMADDGKSTRLRLERAHMIIDDEDNEIVFLLDGSRYKKEGLPGKRSEIISFRVPWKGST